MEEMDLKDVNATICRVCMQSVFEELPLFEEHKNCKISVKINALTNVCIREGDGLPDRICPTCLLELESAFKFKLKCENTNKVLQYFNKNLTQTPVKCFDYVSDPIKMQYSDDGDDDEAPPTGDVSTQSDSFDKFTDSNKKEYIGNVNSDQDDDNVDQIMIAEFSQHNGESDTDMQPHVEMPAPSKAIDLKLECHDCGGFFISKCKLRMHWKNVHLLEHLKCPKCKRQFKQYKPYNSHMKRICIDTSQVHVEGEGKNRVFHCKECSYHSRSLTTMVSHSVVHTGARPFECDICHKTFTQRASILAHKEIFHKIYKSGGACPRCGKYIQGKFRLANHIYRHTIVYCKICNKKLNQGSLDNHMKRHTGIKEFVCELCSFACYTSAELYQHKNSVHVQELISCDRRIECNICNYTCKNKKTLAGHKKKHTDTNTCCHICGRFFDNEKQLALHMTKHMDRKFQCFICEKTFKTQKNLYGHIRKVHNKVKS